MVKTLSLMLLLALAFGAQAAAAPGAEKAITGFHPYTLGTDAREVLRADPELSEGIYPAWNLELLTRNYGRSIVAPFGGTNHIAALGLQFWQGRLAAVILKWSPTKFDSAGDWRRAAALFHREAMGGYAQGLVRNDRMSSPWEWTVELADAQGNELSAWSHDYPLGITVAYLWAPYVKALEVGARNGGRLAPARAGAVLILRAIGEKK